MKNSLSHHCSSILCKRMRQFLRIVLTSATLLVASAISAAAADNVQRAELIMFEHDGCPWCVAWHRDVGRVYAKTWEGKAAPLRRVDIRAPIPGDLDTITIERATPVFVLLMDGEEKGRIRGYPGDDFFWGLLGKILKDAGITAPQTN